MFNNSLSYYLTTDGALDLSALAEKLKISVSNGPFFESKNLQPDPEIDEYVEYVPWAFAREGGSWSDKVSLIVLVGRDSCYANYSRYSDKVEDISTEQPEIMKAYSVNGLDENDAYGVMIRLKDAEFIVDENLAKAFVAALEWLASEDHEVNPFEDLENTAVSVLPNQDES